MDAYDFLREVVVSRRRGSPRGIFSVCSGHPAVIAATLTNARDRGSFVLLESTSNQVNQFGGYTGMTPAQYFQWIRGLEQSLGVPKESVLIGGDHLGPFPWRTEPAGQAMDKATRLVQDCVRAGYGKIHLDATMRLADDPGDHARPLDPRLSAERTAHLCQAAEASWQELRKDQPDARPPLYVIGSDVPLPGGTPSVAIAPEVTRVDDLSSTMELCRSAFLQRGLSDAWKRVVAVVVQPSVEHGAFIVHPYIRRNVEALTGALRGLGSVVFEAHATDYQTGPALREMVEDGFGILKVGPSLTTALREALFLLTHIEEVLAASGALTPSRVPQALDAAMVGDPRHWQAYYTGDEKELAFARAFGLSDRCRYYWNVPSVEKAVEHLKSNLRGVEIPLSLLSQYLPRQYPRVRLGLMSADPDHLIEAQIAEVLDLYQRAVQPPPRGRFRSPPGSSLPA
jgi:D-tagatose-1,6-bisphosphate aldolase subunit GatZ/KbaZ